MSEILLTSAHSNLSMSNTYGSVAEHDQAQITKRIGSNLSTSDTSSSVLNKSIRDSMTSLGASIQDEIHHGLHFGGENVSIRQLGGTSTITKSSINLMKNLVGAGVLALPSGVASFADSPSALWPATFWTLIMGAIFAYEFQLIGNVCSITRSTTFREAWQDTVGTKGSLVVSLVNILKPALGSLSYSMILADTFRSLFGSIGMDVSRNVALSLVTFLGIVPLCLLKNLDALAPFSAVGTGGIVLTVVCMGVRYWDGSYDPLRNGRFLNDIPYESQPVFGSYDGSWTEAILIFVAMLYEAFVAHYNAPRFYNELKDASLGRFRVVVGNAFGLTSVLYVTLTMFGFLTFGGNCDGYILNNYSVQDPLATICRVAIAFSLLFTYPLAFMGLRDGVLDSLQLPIQKQTTWNVNIITMVLLTLLTALASIITDLGYLNVIGGGTLAAAIVFVFPYMMYSSVIQAPSLPPIHKVQRMELSFALGLLVLGVVMGLIGVMVEIQA